MQDYYAVIHFGFLNWILLMGLLGDGAKGTTN